MPVYNTPGLYFQMVDSQQGKIPGIRTDIPGFIGIAEKGPLNQPVRIESWKQFQSIFGGWIPQGYLAYAVHGFFENEGDTCFVVRIADIDKAKKATASLVDRNVDPLIIVTAVNQGQWGNKIKVSLQEESSGTTITAFMHKCSSCGYIYDETRERIPFEALPGHWICPACDAAKTSFQQFSLQPATSESYSIVRGVTGFETGSLVRVFQDKSGTPLRKYHIIDSVDSGSKKIAWASPLETEFDINKPIYFSTVEFTFTFLCDDKLKEVFKNLSLSEDHSRYLEDVIEIQSNLVRVKCQKPSSINPLHLPDTGKIKKGGVYLEDGEDGISGIEKSDFLGDPLSETKTGLRCYEDVDEVGMICIPGIMIQPVRIPPPYVPPPKTPDPCLLGEKEPAEEAAPSYIKPQTMESPPRFSDEEIREVQRHMIEHCELMNDRIAILDPPWDADLLEIQEWKNHFDSKYAALYYPWIRVRDPLKLDNQIIRLIPPSGHVAGIYARVDRRIGVHKAPANEEVLGAEDVAVTLESSHQDILNPMGINCIRVFPGRGIRLWGARTISSNKSWRFVNIRRLLIMIEEAVETAMQWAVFEPNDHRLRIGIRLSVSVYLEELWRKGALAGAAREEAFFVTCDQSNNPREVVDAGKVITDIGVAPSIPGEFIIFRIGKVEDRMRVMEDT